MLLYLVTLAALVPISTVESVTIFSVGLNFDRYAPCPLLLGVYEPLILFVASGSSTFSLYSMVQRL